MQQLPLSYLQLHVKYSTVVNNLLEYNTSNEGGLPKYKFTDKVITAEYLDQLTEYSQIKSY